MTKAPKELCLEDMQLRILSTELPPGSILDEASLAAHYGLSRTPLREVLQRLAGAGFVSLAGHRGAKVASMDIDTMRTFFQTAPMIYANVSRLAAENRTKMQLRDLQIVQSEFAKCTGQGDAAAAALANHRFHALIGEMANNPYLAASLDRLLIDHTRLSQTFYRPDTAADAALVGKACGQHDALIRAIETRDTALAVDLTLQHWDLSRDSMERFVRPDPLPVNLVDQEGKSYAV